LGKYRLLKNFNKEKSLNKRQQATTSDISSKRLDEHYLATQTKDGGN
jgi:hypothetical protein